MKKESVLGVILLSVLVCILVCLLAGFPAKREFPIDGSNVADLDTERVVDRIARAEKLDDGSELCVNDGSFDLMLTPDFNWASDGAIRFFYTKDQETFSAQLRMFHGENQFFITESGPWTEQEQSFKLFHYLNALKYMPQEEIRQLSPDADRYCVYMRNDGTPGDYARVLEYSQNGTGEIEGWQIHLEIQPLHEAPEGGYRGSGDELIHLFYSHRDTSG